MGAHPWAEIINVLLMQKLWVLCGWHHFQIFKIKEDILRGKNIHS